MSKVIQKVPAYGDRRTFLDEQGNVVVVNDDVIPEVLQRLYSHKGSYIFKRDYGSDVYKLINSKKENVSNMQIESYVKEALKPMIENGSITERVKVISERTNQGIATFDIIVYNNIQQRYQNVSFKSLIYN